MIEKILSFQIKYSKIIFILLLLIIGTLGYISKDIKIDPELKSLIPQDSEYNTNDLILKNAFPSDDAMIIFLTKDKTSILKNVPKNMQDERVLMYLDEIKNALEQSQFCVEILGPLFAEDLNSVQLIVKINSPNKIGATKEISEEFQKILTEVGSPIGIKTTLTGFPIVIDKIPTFLIKDNLNTIIITLIAIFFILYFYSRDFYFTLTTISIPISSLLVLGGLMVLLKINITITLAAVAVLTLGLGADYAIHISTHYSKLIEKHDTHKHALIQTTKEMWLPITASFITTLGGFAALILGVSPSSQAQGIVLSLAIIIIYVLTFSLFPILITLFSKKINIKPNIIFEKIMLGLAKLAYYQTRYAKMILWIVGILTIIMMYGASMVEFNTSNSNWIPDDDEIITANREVESAFGGRNDIIEIVLISNEGDLRNAQVQRDVLKLKSKLEGITIIDSIQTPYDNLNYDTNEIFEKLTNEPNLRKLFNKDFTLTRIIISSKNPGLDSNGKSIILRKIRDVLKTSSIYNTDYSLYGNQLRFEELGDNLQKDASITTIYGFGLVFFVASMIYASLFIGIQAIIPIIIAIIWTIGLMGFFGVPFTSLSTGIVSLVLGIGVDFSIHLVDSIKKYTKTMKFEKAIFETMNTSGRAIFLSSFTTFVGFIALTFARLLGTQRLGWSLGFSIIAVFIVSILFVPSVMSILHKRELKKLKRKRLKIDLNI